MTTPKVPKTPKVIEKSITLEQLVAQVAELRIELEALKAVKAPPKPIFDESGYRIFYTGSC
jgi:hypothetical protein